MDNEVNTENALFLQGECEKDAVLSCKEMQVLKYLSGGLSEKEIACKMNISYRTVRKHIENMKSKTGLSKNTELIGYYVAGLRNKEFSLKKLREYGIAAFLIFIHVCKIDV